MAKAESRGCAPRHAPGKQAKGTQKRKERPRGALRFAQDEAQAQAAAGPWRRFAMKASNSSRSFARLSSSTNSANAVASSSRRRRSSSSRSSSRRRYSSKAKLPVDENLAPAPRAPLPAPFHGQPPVPPSRLKFFSKKAFASFGTV